MKPREQLQTWGQESSFKHGAKRTDSKQKAKRADSKALGQGSSSNNKTKGASIKHKPSEQLGILRPQLLN